MKLYKRKTRRKKRFDVLALFKPKKNIGRVDYLLIGTIFFILFFGLAMLSSASSVESFRSYGNAYHLFNRQLLFGLLPGLIAFFVLSRIDYSKYRKYTLWFFIAMIGMLILVFIPGLGVSYGRAQSWINLGGFSFQPSEMSKLFLILSLAGWFSQRGKEMTKDFWNGLMPFAVALGLVSLPIILQPDIGTLMVVVSVAFMMYFVAGGLWKHFVGLAILGIGTVGILIAQAPYRAARLLTFLNPEVDPQGIGYHINQAFLAVGSGGWFGLGFGQSRQKFAYLPEAMGDSIFAIIAEEVGFIFSVLLIVAFIVIVLRGLKLAQKISDDYARLVIVGIVAWFGFQAFFNIGAMVGILPLTGIPLPFVSYGGTALLSTMAAAGILANISRHK